MNNYGSQNQPGESFAGTAADSARNNFGGGGGGYHWPGRWSGGGGGGGYGTAGEKGYGDQEGAKGFAGQPYGTATLTRMFLGSGGGGGSENRATTHGRGGNGGGIVYIRTDELQVAGAIQANGEMGHHEQNHSSKDAGGSGSGGSIYLDVNAASLGDARVTANGAARPAGSANGYPNSPGGYGGAGRIAVHYVSAIQGTTSPLANVTQE